MKRFIAISLCFVLLLSVSVGCSKKEEPEVTKEPSASTSSPAADAEAAPVVYKLGHMSPLENNYNLLAEKFKALVEKNSDGRIQIQIYPQAQLGYDRDLLEAMQFGTVDFAVNTSAPISNFEKLYSVLDLPYLFNGWEQIENFVVSDAAMELLKKSEEDGLVGLGIMGRGFRSVSNNVKPINTPDDLQGIKIRVLESPAYVKTFEDFGAVVSAMSWGEVYTALQQGAIDGQENPPETVKTERVNEVQKYYSLTQHIAGFACIMGSGITWDKIPAEDQKIIREAALEASLAQTKENMEKEKAYIEELKADGMEVNEVDTSLFSEKTTSPYEWFNEQCGEDGQAFIEKIKELK